MTDDAKKYLVAADVVTVAEGAERYAERVNTSDAWLVAAAL